MSFQTPDEEAVSAHAGAVEIAPEMDRESLKAASVNGVAVTIGSQFVRLALQFAYQVLIARLLLPRDFGLVALCAPAIAFVQLFADLGLTQATVQKAAISQPQLSFLFWVNVGLGLVLAGATFAAAPLVGMFYGDPRVVPLTRAFGALLAVGGFYSQHLALLNRRMRFGSLAIVDLASFGCGALAGLGAARSGMGAWALFINSGVTSLSTLLLAWSITRWAPGRPTLHEARGLLSFGGNLTGLNVVNFFARNLDNVLVGRFSGIVSLGLYDRAYKLCLLPFNQIVWPFARVGGPLLSRSASDTDLYRRAYLSLLQTMLLFTYPAVVYAILFSDRLILLGLGARWLGVVPIFRVLALDAFVAPIASSLGWLLVSQGRTVAMRNCGMASSVIFLACFAAGVLVRGPVGVAAGYALAGVVELIILALATSRRGPIGLRVLVAAISPILVCAGATALALAILRPLAPVTLLGLLGSGMTSYLVFAGLLLLFPGGRRLLDAMRTQGQDRLRGMLKRVAA